MRLKKESWHYKLASVMSENIKYQHVCQSRIDLCAYARAVLMGLVGCVVLFWFALGASWCVVDVVIWTIACLQYGAWFLPNTGALVAVMALALLLIACTIKAVHWTVTNNVPEPIVEGYKAWKGKYCPTVDFD